MSRNPPVVGVGRFTSPDEMVSQERIAFIFDHIPPGPLKYPPGQAKQRTA